MQKSVVCSNLLSMGHYGKLDELCLALSIGFSCPLSFCTVLYHPSWEDGAGSYTVVTAAAVSLSVYDITLGGRRMSYLGGADDTVGGQRTINYTFAG